MKTNKIYVILVITLCEITLLSCKDAKPKVSNEYEIILSKMNKMGMFNGNVLILKKGEIVYKGAFGLNGANMSDSLNLDSQFRLASISKTFTATGIIQLKEIGKLSYDQDIRDFIPELPYVGITVRHLLNHVSGLPDYATLMDVHWKPQLRFNDPNRVISGNDDILAMLVHKKPTVLFSPGERYKYSNTGYILLASIIERLSGMPYSAYITEKIFNPAEMKNSRVYKYVRGKDLEIENRVYGFQRALNGRDLIPNDFHYLNPALGDDGIYSTIEDLLKWDRILYTEKIISDESKKEAFAPSILNNGDSSNYGLGWQIRESLSGKKVVSHTGGWVGFITYFHREIEEDNCVIFLTNNSTQYRMGAVHPLMDILHNRPYSIPKIQIYEVIGETITNEGIHAALKKYAKLKSEDFNQYQFHESQLNDLGYQLLGEYKTDEAIAVFRLNTEQYPTSANAYDSLGDGYLEKGDSDNALINFKKALAIDSNATGSLEKIKRIENMSLESSLNSELINN